MSYIYAHKTENSIKILSDTKVTINSNDLSRLKKRFSEKEYNNFLKYGFIKTIIYKPNITISSAGEVEHFNELLSFLYQNNINDIAVIQNKALEINVHYNRDTDFIITTEKEIFKVAEKKFKMFLVAGLVMKMQTMNLLNLRKKSFYQIYTIQK